MNLLKVVKKFDSNKKVVKPRTGYTKLFQMACFNKNTQKRSLEKPNFF